MHYVKSFWLSVQDYNNSGEKYNSGKKAENAIFDRKNLKPAIGRIRQERG